jgi:VanZ family protein
LNEPSRLPRSRRRAAVIGILAIVVATLVPLGESPAPRLARALADAAHLPVFAALTLLLFALAPAGPRALGSIARAAGGAAALALVVELLQALVGRTASLQDLAVGWTGVVLAAWGLALRLPRFTRRGRALHGLVAALATLFVLAPAWPEWRAARLRLRNLPQIGDFEDDLELRLWVARRGRGMAPSRLAPSTEHAVAGRRSLRVESEGGSWGGVEYAGGRLNCRGYRALAFSVINPGEPFQLQVRLQQATLLGEPPAASTPFSIGVGTQRVRVPLDRSLAAASGEPLDLARIARIAFISGRDQPPLVWYLDDVRLEGREEAPAEVGYK